MKEKFSKPQEHTSSVVHGRHLVLSDLQVFSRLATNHSFTFVFPAKISPIFSRQKEHFSTDKFWYAELTFSAQSGICFLSLMPSLTLQS